MISKIMKCYKCGHWTAHTYTGKDRYLPLAAPDRNGDQLCNVQYQVICKKCSATYWTARK